MRLCIGTGLVLKVPTWYLLFQVLLVVLPGFGLPTAEAQKLWRRWPDPGAPSLSETKMNLTVVAGGAAKMRCRVANLGDKTVSWIRGIDLTVLAVDRITYTGDQRFTVKHPEGTNDWVLELKEVSSADEGLYDCQVNTHPKLSTKVYLHVVPKHAVDASLIDMAVSDTDLSSRTGGIPTRLLPSNTPIFSESIDGSHIDITIKIDGERLVHRNIGDVLKLTCRATGKGVDYFITARPKDEQLLRWMLDGVPVTSLFPEWKVKVRESLMSDSGIVSEMILEYLGADDSGKIECNAAGTVSTSVNLHVVEEKTSNQHYSGTSTSGVQRDTHKHPFQLTSAVSSGNNGNEKPNTNSASVTLSHISTMLYVFIVKCFYLLYIKVP